MDDIENLAILAVAVVATSFLSGIFGMAGGMVLMGLLVAIMPVTAAMALHGIAQMASNGCRAWMWRADIRWHIVLRFVVGAALALVAFASFTMRPTKAQALLILGLTPFASLLLPARARLNVTRAGQGMLCGALCTGLQLAAGVSGPILDLFFVNTGLDRRAIVATKAAVQTIGHALKLAYFGALLSLDGDGLAPVTAAAAALLAIIGTQASRGVLERMTDDAFVRWSRRLIVAIGAAYLCQGAFMMIRDAHESTACAAPTCGSIGRIGDDRRDG